MIDEVMDLMGQKSDSRTGGAGGILSFVTHGSSCIAGVRMHKEHWTGQHCRRSIHTGVN